MTSRRDSRRLRRTGAALVLYAAILFATGVHIGDAQTLPPGTEPYDVTADYSTVRNVGGETVIELSQNVRVVHGDVTVTGDHGTSYTEKRITTLRGHVRVTQETLVMTGEEGEYRQTEDLAIIRRNVHIVDRGRIIDCDEARYSRTTGQAWLIGHVVGRDSTSVLHTDRLLYDRITGRSEAFDNVEITSKSQGIVVRGHHGIFDRNRSEGLVDRDPVLVSGPDDPEPVTVVSDTMRVYPDSSRASAYYRVRIIKGNTVTQCDSAMVFDDQKRVELYGHPIAKQENVVMRGDRMVAYYNANEVYRVDVFGSALITETPKDTLITGRDSQIRGDEITLHLHGSGIDSLRVTGHAESEYYPSTPKKSEANSIRGDQMYFRFGKDAIDFVDVAGKADGIYRYLDLKTGETSDSLRALADTSYTYVPFATHSQRVAYSAERVQYIATKKQLLLNKSARVEYHDSELTGETIAYYYDLQVLDAAGSPVLNEEGQKLYGERMDYGMDSRTGLVTEGATRYEQGYYTGKTMAKVGENEMKVWNSWYTTCDLKQPHYHFAARTMKVYPNDKVFTGPIWLYIGQTPVFALPFMANSISHGRRSGFLRPDFEFGFTSNKGRYISGLGYYWATNDYTDFKFVSDFYEDSRWRLYVGNRYALRYKLSGNVDFSFVRQLSSSTNEWTFDSAHQQTLGPQFNLSASLRFVSSDNAPSTVNTIDNVNRYIDSSIRSNVAIGKSWGAKRLSLSASRTQNLNVVSPSATKLDMTLPNVTLSIPSTALDFGALQDSKGFWAGLLKGTRISPSLSGNRQYTEKLYEKTDVTTGNAGLGLSSPQRLGFLTITPGVRASLVSSYTDFQQQAHTSITTSSGVPDTVMVPALHTTDTHSDFTWSMGASASTNFYGTFYPHIGKLRGLRHRVTPTASYSYSPERGMTPRQQSVSLGLQQSLDLKVATASPATGGGTNNATAGDDNTTAGADTTAEENVRKLSSVVNWNLGTTYRPDVPVDRAWSNISSSFNTVIAGANLSLNHTIDAYSFNLLNTNAQASFSIRGSHPFGRSSTVEVKELNAAAAADTADSLHTGSYNTGGVEFIQTTGSHQGETGGPGSLSLKEGRQPWDLSLALTYSKGSTGLVSSTLRLGWDVKLTDNWSIQYSTIYDVQERILQGQNFTITRDLHCWAMSFSRQQLGDEWQYYFRISLKAHPELYGESGSRGVPGGLGGGLIGQF